ncbi:MAG: hypothetical protein JW893_07855 [Candidatus Omnitrophica bacterium]|nr:hypothetical protein [Candidatus Omnitrophota bacterium]
MTYLAERQVLQIVLILIFAVVFYFRKENNWLKKYFVLILALLTLLGFTAHFNFFLFHGGRTHLHNLEIYHYYMGSKYFPELGYTKLYEASLVADSEDDPYFRGDLAIRSLETYELEPRSEVLARKSEIAGLFTKERWREFKEDLSVFRLTAPTNWGVKFGYQDHGYNGTPFVTAILSFLSSQPFLSTRDFIQIAACLDILLILLCGGLIAILLGLEAGLVFLFCLAVNPLNDYLMIGGAYLRYSYLVALALGIAFYRKNQFILSGILVAVSGLLRIFPGLCVVGLFLSHLLRKDRLQALKSVRSFYLSFFVAGGLIFLMTSILPKPAGENPWRGFARQIELHRGKLTTNKVGLRYLFFFSDEHNVREVLKSWPDGQRLNWIEENEKTYEGRKPFFFIAVAAMLFLLACFLRASHGAEAFFGGVVFIFCVFLLSHYYYCLLSLIPLMFSECRKITIFTVLAFGAMTAVALLPEIGGIVDRRFYFSSLTTLFLMVGILSAKSKVAKETVC